MAKVGLEADGLEGDQLPNVLEFEDQELASGRVGFLANNNNGFFVDKFEYVPVNCYNEPKVPPIEYLAPECSRFFENYFGSYLQRWRWRDPKAYQDGPAEWDFAVDVGDRKKAVYQKSQIKSAYPDKIGTISWLVNKKFFKDGYLNVEFYAKRDGIVGILFRYHDYHNYYSLEIGGETAKFLQFRKNVGGRYHTVQKSMGNGYEIGKWYTVTIYASGNVIKTYFYETGKAYAEAFPTIDDEDLKEGTIGFSTFMTPCAFDKLKFFPIGDLKVEEGEGDDGPSTEDIPIKALAEVDKSAVYANSNIKKLTWDECIDNAKPEEREKFCEEKYGSMSKDAVKYCSVFNVFT